MQTNKTILIIEDEKSLREAIVDILVMKNFLALEARNGREGVDVALSRHPDLILLDLIMPEMDGMAALKKIRADTWGKNVPVIILTNLNGTIEHFMDDIVTNYLIKSDWKIHDIVEMIEKVLEKHKLDIPAGAIL